MPLVKKPNKNALFLSVIIILSLCFFAEGATRIHHLFKYGYLSRTKKVIYKGVKNTKQIMDDAEKVRSEAYPYLMYRVKPDQSFATITVNALGFRGRQVARIKPEATVRVVMLGGSALWGTGASSDKTTIAYELEKLLNNPVRGKKYEVINAGDGGYVTMQELITLCDRVIDLAPDIIVTFDGFNDIYSGFTNGIAGYPQNFSYFKQKLEANSIFYHFFAGLTQPLAHSMFIRKLSNKIRIFYMRSAKVDSDGIPLAYADSSEVARIFGRNLSYIHAITKERNIISLFTIQPMLGVGAKKLTPEEQASLKALGENIRSYAAYLRRTAGFLVKELKSLEQSARARVLDLTGVFDSNDATVYLDYCHISDASNKVIAEKIYGALKTALPQD